MCPREKTTQEGSGTNKRTVDFKSRAGCRRRTKRGQPSAFFCFVLFRFVLCALALYPVVKYTAVCRLAEVFSLLFFLSLSLLSVKVLQKQEGESGGKAGQRGTMGPKEGFVGE